MIAKWLLREPRVFILDEPTRGIDVGAKYEIYKLINQLAAEGTGILFISSEIEELIGMCDRILVMAHGEIRGIHERLAFDREAMLAVGAAQRHLGAGVMSGASPRCGCSLLQYAPVHPVRGAGRRRSASCPTAS